MVFFKDGIMYERACETNSECDTDQLSFKAYFSRWLTATTRLAPFTESRIMPLLNTSAQAAAKQCDGGTDGVTCGYSWLKNSTWDGTYGVGQQMSALEVVQGLLVKQAVGTVTNSTGGTSVGNSAAGAGSASSTVRTQTTTITTADRVGAGILTVLIVVIVVGGSTFMVMAD